MHVNLCRHTGWRAFRDAFATTLIRLVQLYNLLSIKKNLKDNNSPTNIQIQSTSLTQILNHNLFRPIQPPRY